MDRDKWIKAKHLVNERDGGICQKCPDPATDVHHRVTRGMGGSRDDTLNYGMANLVALCRSCHDEVHAHPAASYNAGWLVRTGNDPAVIPLVVTKDMTIWLKDDGTSRFVIQETLF
jgi:5-methylcytosine-specific restriction enzyme A